LPRRKSRYREGLREVGWLLRSPREPVELPPGAPATVEVGMGAGHVLVARAHAERGRRFVGVEIKEERAYQAARAAAALGLDNVAFVVGELTRVADALPSGRFDEIMILFPDPWPRRRDAGRRLVSPRCLGICRRWMSPGARGLLRTDNPSVVAYARMSLPEAGCTITSISEDAPPGDVQTRYEARFRSEAARISEIRFHW
jgi:tRNA (guanine-N7-)-methyltransferase